jgi:hypothetical protein
MRALSIAVLAVTLGACGHNIGDACTVNVDCQPDGTRFCDTSPPDGLGYCTIEGCDVGTCPPEAICVRFLTPVFDEPCTLPTDHQVPLSQGDCPHEDDRCVCDHSLNGICQPATGDPTPSPSPMPNGHCAPESTERRWCQLHCNSNGDCRTNYECRQTGTLGAEPVPTLTNLTGGFSSFCAPNSPKH